MSIMTTTPELLELMQRDRERRSENGRLAAIAARIRDCCRQTLFVRIASALRGNAATR